MVSKRKFKRDYIILEAKDMNFRSKERVLPKAFAKIEVNDEKLEDIIKELQLDEKDENSIRTFVIVLSLIAQASAIKKLVQKIVKEYHS